jgi:uncharacterized protein YyaL (SSP411 family)
MDALPAANLLDRETSPYLLQHKDNPVHWRAWGPEALAEAQRLDRPILLSSGYSACHWCHVMAHESFEDAETAAFLNDNFVNIKVDREERPDIDGIFQTTLQALGQQGGWPMTMFLTPKGEPFVGGTYFPKVDRPEIQRRSFLSVLNDVVTTFRDRKDQIAKNVEGLRTGLQNLWRLDRRTQGTLSSPVLDVAAKRICQSMDVFHGGIIGPPKFPNVPVMEVIWRAHLRTGMAQFHNALELQLRYMCAGGIYDHLGGGFSRYATDESWLVPHFEKMLYDNAMMIWILALVWQDTRTPQYRNRIEETVAWLKREMLLPEGAFAAAIDADSEGEEGRYYTWTLEEISKILPDDEAKLFAAAYDVREAGNWNNRNVLNRLVATQFDAIQEGRLNAIRQKLLQIRQKRVRPQLDVKILADWNGQTIHALCFAADAMGRLDWQAQGVRAFWFIAENMADGDRLSHSYCNGTASGVAFSDDYAHMIRAALILFELTSDKRYLEKAVLWCARLDAAYWDQTLDGYCQTAEDGEPVFVRPRVSFDSALPSANGIMIDNLAKLYFVSGDREYRDRSVRLLDGFSQHALSSPVGHASYFNGFDSVLRAQQIVIVGDRNSPDTQALRESVRHVSLPARVLMIVSGSDQLPAIHPAFGKVQVQGRATAYLCNATQCSAPITDSNQLELMLKTRIIGTRPGPGTANVNR